MQWGTICDSLPWEENKREEGMRRYLHIYTFCCGIVRYSPTCFSELWSLININDSKSLTMYELEKGIATVTRSEEFFDCLPAVRAAFNFTKVLTNKGVDEDEEEEKKAQEEKKTQEKEKKMKKPDEIEAIKVPTRKVEKTLEYEEFRMFLQTLRQYFIYCQVGQICQIIYIFINHTPCSGFS